MRPAPLFLASLTLTLAACCNCGNAPAPGLPISSASQTAPTSSTAVQLPAEWADLRRETAASIKVFTSHYFADAAQWGEECPNPFTAVTAEGRKKFAAQGIDIARLATLKARKISGEYYGANLRDFVNLNPNLVLVIADDFGSHGGVYSLGPVVAIGNAHFMGQVMAANLLWFVDSSFPRNKTTGIPIVVSPTVHTSQVQFSPTSPLLRGDYGWKRPANYPAAPPSRF